MNKIEPNILSQKSKWKHELPNEFPFYALGMSTCEFGVGSWTNWIILWLPRDSRNYRRFICGQLKIYYGKYLFDRTFVFCILCHQCDRISRCESRWCYETNDSRIPNIDRTYENVTNVTAPTTTATTINDDDDADNDGKEETLMAAESKHVSFELIAYRHKTNYFSQTTSCLWFDLQKWIGDRLTFTNVKFVGTEI